MLQLRAQHSKQGQNADVHRTFLISWFLARQQQYPHNLLTDNNRLDHKTKRIKQSSQLLLLAGQDVRFHRLVICLSQNLQKQQDPTCLVVLQLLDWAHNYIAMAAKVCFSSNYCSKVFQILHYFLETVRSLLSKFAEIRKNCLKFCMLYCPLKV